ncbi:MAG: YbjQ family protein [Burkholderiales bacterium]
MQVLFEYFELLVGVALAITGLVVGRWIERRHYASIRRRERQLADILVFAVRFPPPRLAAPAASLVAGSVVIADDYFKGLVAGLHTFFGGRVRSYESLVDRARREAVLRMKAEARQRGAGMIVNVKFQTFSIPGRRPGSMRAVEVLAYGTAVTAPARGA